MSESKAIQCEFDDTYAAAECALSNGDISAYIAAGTQIYELYDGLDRSTHILRGTRVEDDRTLSREERLDLEALRQHLSEAQTKLDEHIVRVWNEEWNGELQAHLAEAHKKNRKRRRVTDPNDPRYG